MGWKPGNGSSSSSTSGANSASDRLYSGQDLTVSFASEISKTTNCWAWIKARITAGNYTGIHVGDYIPFALSGGTVTNGTTPYTFVARTFKAVIAGINTYTGSNFTYPVGNHIDFISEGITDIGIPWQTSDNNNGSSYRAAPWLTSIVYSVLNGVNNLNSGKGYALTSGSILSQLPTALQGTISEKISLQEDRYSSSSTLTVASGIEEYSMGKLWLPNEFEVYGANMYSGIQANAMPVQYPLFAGNVLTRMKAKSTGAYYIWRLNAVATNSSANVCYVTNGGYATSTGASYAINVPICFRISA